MTVPVSIGWTWTTTTNRQEALSRKSAQKKKQAGGTRKIKPLPRRAQAAGVNSAAAQPKTAQETPEAIYLDIDTLRGDAG
jgi:hypothetical protein